MLMCKSTMDAEDLTEVYIVAAAVVFVFVFILAEVYFSTG
jgi:hypothetical protein